MSFKFSSSRKPPGSSSMAASVGIALLGGTQITLTLLEKLMDPFPLSFVKGLAGAGVEVIKMARIIQSNKKECEELQKRSASLLVVILDSLKGKEENEIPDDLKQGLDRLTKNFLDVTAELKVVERRSNKGSLAELSRSILYHHDNAEVLKNCIAKLDWAMQEFQVASKVDSSLDDLKRHEELLRGQAQIQKSQVNIEQGQTELKHGQAELLKGHTRILEAMEAKAYDAILSDQPSTQLPADPRIFGRDEYINSAVLLLLSKPNIQMVILGPGGMGKTSAALKIVHDSRVVERFEDNILWVPCEQATSVPLLLEVVAKAIQLPTSSSPDRLKEIINKLKSSPDLVLLLDNFETPWDIPNKQSDVGAVLARLAQIPSVSLILTMRGSQTPVPSIDWAELPRLEKLELNAAREAFIKICPKASTDSQLDTLLGELDCVPLAITLTASLARGRDTPSDLLSRWRSERTKMLSKPGGDRLNSVDTSIKLSLESNLVKRTPGVIDLLSVLAKLPAGAKYTRLPEICQSIPNWREALDVLDNSALTYEWTDKEWVRVLSPIRSYVHLYHPVKGDLLKDLHAVYFTLAEKGKLGPNNPEFLRNVNELAEEETNLETILVEMLGSAVEVGDGDLEASLNYSNYCYWTHPQTTVIRMAVKAARRSNSVLLPKCLQSLGDILRVQNRYDEAKSVLEDARTSFVKLGNQLGAAQCQRSLGTILRMQAKYDEAKSALEDARAAFVKLGDQVGAAQSLRSLGNILRMQNKFDEAKPALEDARAAFVKLGDQVGAAQCLMSLGNILYMQDKYDEAKSVLEEARTAFVKLGDQLGAAQCLRLLGNILYKQDKYDEAKSALEDARTTFVILGDQLGAARCLKSLGNILYMQNQYDEARSVLEDSRVIYDELGFKNDATECTKLLLRIPSL
ncbi:hypothetical protein FRC02_010922 [Tulasnella sp. 418]|nr:hypothetical protein FRC02_010922 [Tulasnella sp. 418]